MTGLVLTAGGARGAYQAGVLKRLGELRSFRGRPSPFAIVSGASAGAINGSILAARSEDFTTAANEVARVWSELRVEQVFRTDLAALALEVRPVADGDAAVRLLEAALFQAADHLAHRVVRGARGVRVVAPGLEEASQPLPRSGFIVHDEYAVAHANLLGREGSVPRP